MYKLMIADTSHLFAKSVGEQMQCGCEVEICDRGDQVLNMISTFNPDLLLYDTMIPELMCVLCCRS